jgi:predicted PurR-regulated permease PerM
MHVCIVAARLRSDFRRPGTPTDADCRVPQSSRRPTSGTRFASTACMATRPTTDRPRPRRRRRRGPFTRSRGKLLVVSAASIVCVYLCYRLVQPFLPALVWATTGAVITHSVMGWLAQRITKPHWRAGVGVTGVALLLFGPAIALVYFAALEIYGTLQSLNPADLLASWQQAFAGRPALANAWARITENVDLQAMLAQLGEQLSNWSLAILTGFFYLLFQAVIALFILFFLYRDEDYVLATIHRLSPFTNDETRRLRQRIGDTIHATIAGVVVVAIVQGTLGGMIFALLGIPAPVLWGAAMAVMAMVPYLGTPSIWGPTAIFLAANGEWGKALILAAWGMLAIGLIDNLLYPMLVGNRLRQHTVVAFLAILGGVALFGATGIVLGPVIVTVTFFLLEVWRRRTEAGQTAERA